MLKRKHFMFWLKHRIKMIKIEIRYHKRNLKNIKLAYLKRQYIFSMLTRRCGGKGIRCMGGWAYIQHSNCAYVDELSNYNYCCKDCHEEIDAHYQELWDDYNASRL